MLEVKPLPRNDPEFYRLMGPFFGSRSVAAEIGIHVYDDESKQWAIAMRGSVVVGFASVRGPVITDCYVVPGSRNQGIFAEILAFILEHSQGSSANCTSASLPAFLKAGFQVVSKTKNFTKVKRNA